MTQLASPLMVASRAWSRTFASSRRSLKEPSISTECMPGSDLSSAIRKLTSSRGGGEGKWALGGVGNGAGAATRRGAGNGPFFRIGHVPVFGRHVFFPLRESPEDPGSGRRRVSEGSLGIFNRFHCCAASGLQTCSTPTTVP